MDSETRNLVTKHQETVLQALRDVDISIRKRALDLLYGMCDKSTAKTIVSELLNYLASADFAIKEELVNFPPLFPEFSAKFLTLIGDQDRHFGREICCRLFLVCGCYFPAHRTGGRFCNR